MALDVGLVKKNRSVCFEAILTQSSIYQLTMSSVCIGTVRKAMATQTTRQLCKRYLTVMLALLSSVCWLFVSAYAVPYGTYVVTNTLHIPLGTRLYGEAQPVILGSHPKFNDSSAPIPVIQVGRPGDMGELVICDMIFSTRGPAAGAIIVEWNVHEATQGSAAMFDSHIRVGGFRGTDLEISECPKEAPLNALPRASCLNLHLTKTASGYFQNVWVWTADHELDIGAPAQINVLSERGVLIESQGPVWMYGTASEHHLLYQYSLVQAHNVLLAMIQTESPYFQGQAFAPATENVCVLAHFPDPNCSRRYMAGPEIPPWSYNKGLEDRSLGLHMNACNDIFVLGAGLYSFFDSYRQDSLSEHACQRRLCTIDDAGEQSNNIWMVNLATVGSQTLVSLGGYDWLLEAPHREGFCSTLALCGLTRGNKMLI